MTTLINQLHENTSLLLNHLLEKGDLSLHSFANENLRKVLLLSAASWFETRISAAIIEFSKIHSNGHSGIQSIIKKKAVDRQYHTYFDWKNEKPGPFYSIFGELCGDCMKKEISNDITLKTGLDAFLKLGNLRNELVHENFAVFHLEKTAEEVHALYQAAEIFVKYLERRLIDPTLGSTKC